MSRRPDRQHVEPTGLAYDMSCPYERVDITQGPSGPPTARYRWREDETMDAERFVLEAWFAISSGDLSVLESALAPEAKWRALEDGPWNCENRSMILHAMRDRAEPWRDHRQRRGSR